MDRNNVTVEVLVRGRPVREFTHTDGKTYVEGRKGSHFELKITNNHFTDVLAVPSIDGLSVMDGEEAGSDSSGYIIGGFQSITIPGWRLDNDEVAKFLFRNKKKGYAGKMGKGGNEGVVGVMFFHKKPNYNWLFENNHPWNSGGCFGNGGGILRNHNPGPMYGSNTGEFNGGNNITCNMVATQSIGDLPDSHITLTGSAEVGEVQCNANVQEYSAEIPQARGVAQSTKTVAAPEVKQEEKISVGFGKATEHKVHEVSFDRADTAFEAIAIYYDTRQGLEKRGIQVVKPKPAVEKDPNPFPRAACQPPKGWRK